MSAAAWFAMAMALLALVVWVTSRVLFPEPIVDRHEQGDDL